MKSSQPRTTFHITGAISWVVLVTVMFGGYSLLRLLTSEGLGDHQERFFRVGHAHAGVLVAIGVLYGLSAAKTNMSPRNQLISFLVYLAGTLILSGGFFVHMIIGQAGQPSFGTTVMAPVGSLILAGAVIFLAVQLIRTPSATRQPITQ